MKDDDMTFMESVGYILGLGLGIVLRYRTFFTVLFLLGGLGMALVGFQFAIAPARFEIRFGDETLAGFVLIALGTTLWFVGRPAQEVPH